MESRELQRQLGALLRPQALRQIALILDQGTTIHLHEVAAAFGGRIRFRKMKTSIALYAQRMNYLWRLCRM